MFLNAQSFNSDISNWNVSSVTDMNYMFYQASAMQCWHKFEAAKNGCTETAPPSAAPSAAPTASNCPVDCALKDDSHIVATHKVAHGTTYTQHLCYHDGTYCTCECFEE